MSVASFEGKTNLPEEKRYFFRGLGANGANLTVQQGKGATIVRTGEGAYDLKLTENPGVFKGWRVGFGAATPADLKGYTAVRDTPTAWNGTVWVLPFVVYDSTFTAADLIANQYIDLEVVFGVNDGS